MNYKAAVFDLDGTLADTLESIATAANKTLNMLGYGDLPTENYKYYAGDGAKALMLRVLRDSGDVQGSRLDEMAPIYTDVFEEYCMYKVGATEEDLTVLAKLLKPFAPHLASEMLEKLGASDEWPKWEEKYLVSDTVEVVVQVNGKLRAKVSVDTEDLENEDKVTEIALNDENVKKYTKDGVKKTIFVKRAKLLNIVV